jgi:transcription factor STE12
MPNDDDNLGSLEEESPESNHGYLDQGFNIPTSLGDMGHMGMGTSMAPAQQLVAAHNY